MVPFPFSLISGSALLGISLTIPPFSIAVRPLLLFPCSELKAEAGKIGGGTGLARVFSAIYKYPSGMKDQPLEFVLRLNEAVRNVCAIKGVNHKVEAGDEIHSRPLLINKYTTLPLLDILDWAKRGLLGEILKPKS